jgi:hypothetical protein
LRSPMPVPAPPRQAPGARPGHHVPRLRTPGGHPRRRSDRAEWVRPPVAEKARDRAGRETAARRARRGWCRRCAWVIRTGDPDCGRTDVGNAGPSSSNEIRTHPLDLCDQAVSVANDGRLHDLALQITPGVGDRGAELRATDVHRQDQMLQARSSRGPSTSGTGCLLTSVGRVAGVA